MFSKTRVVSAVKALVFMAVLGACLTFASFTPEAGPTPTGWAYLWANQANATVGTEVPLNTGYQFNSILGSISINHKSTGNYTVRFQNLGVNAGVVHVTAYGQGSDYCKVVQWVPSGSDQLIDVRCFTVAGKLVNSMFTLSYMNPVATTPRTAFVWANDPSNTAEYRPSDLYQFNSTGVPNTIQRTAVGTYTVSLPGLGVPDGHVQVTAYGDGSDRCGVYRWAPSGTTLQVFVTCYNISGSLADNRFTLTFVNHMSLIGREACGIAGRTPNTDSIYAWNSQLSVPSYPLSDPTSYYFFGSCTLTPGSTVITHTTVGAYGIKPNFTVGGGDVQVTAYRSGSAHCKVLHWNDTDGIQVRCFDFLGLPVNAYFDVTFFMNKSS